MLVLELCCASLFLVAGVIVWGWRSWNRRGFQTAVPLDGATCLWNEDGRSLVIRQNYFRNVVYLLILLIALLAVLYFLGLLIIDLFKNPVAGFLLLIGNGSLLGMIAAVLAAGIASLWRSLRRPFVHVDASSHLLQVDWGPSKQQIPFNHILFIGLAHTGSDAFGNPKVGVFEIEVMLASAQLLQLCSISGDFKSAKKRSIKVAKQIAEICEKPMMIKKPWAIRQVKR